jgi:metallo-beta-lactamase family protein
VTRPRLRFLGAANTVTGSRFVVEHDGHRVMVDAGLFQGLRHLRRSNWDPFPVDPKTIDAVVLTHAHIDHSGWLPGLVRDGFSGPIHATRRTCDLCRILLPDSAHIHEEQARFANERGFSRHHPALPLYTTADAEAALPLLSPAPYDEPFRVTDAITATLVPAGHILGSASVHLDLDHGGYGLLFSGDLGRGDHPLLRGPGTPPAANTVLVESTYGDSIHGSADDDERAVAEAISRAAARGGSVVIPAFAVDRTELLLLLLQRLMRDQRIPTLPVFADSPMALSVLDVYRAELGDEIDFDPGGGLRECRSVEQSMAIADHIGPAIIISASGMATGGRVLHHLARLLPDPRNAVILCGFQAAGTRGRALADGAQTIRMHGRDIPVRCSVTQLTSMSVHADADGLVAWVDELPERPDHVYVVHGEPHASAALSARLRTELGLEASVPAQFDEVELDGPARDTEVSRRVSHPPEG